MDVHASSNGVMGTPDLIHIYTKKRSSLAMAILQSTLAGLGGGVTPSMQNVVSSAAVDWVFLDSYNRSPYDHF